MKPQPSPSVSENPARQSARPFGLAAMPETKTASILPPARQETDPLQASQSARPQAEILLNKVRRLRKTMRQLQQQAQMQWQTLKQQTQTQQHALESSLNTLTEQLESLAKQHPEWFRNGRSVRFFHGQLGYRSSTAITPQAGKTLLDLLNALQEAEETEAITLKKTVNLRAMHHWSAARLKQVGALRQQRERFWLEVF